MICITLSCLPRQRRKGIQIVIQPGAHVSIAHVQLTTPFLHAGKITGLDELHVKFLRLRGIAPGGLPADKRAAALLVAGEHEYCWFHAISSLF
jgi:hypothetical protein